MVLHGIGSGESGLNGVQVDLGPDILVTVSLPIFGLFFQHDLADEVVVGVMLELPDVLHQGSNVHCVVPRHY